MKDNKDFLAADGDPEETLVTPRFDAVEAETAQPVVPFAEVSSVDNDIADAPEYAPHAGAPAPYVVANPAPRRSWTLASVIVLSALVGTLLGGAGLRYYQQRQRAAAANAAVPEPATPSAQVEAVPPFVEENQTAVLPANIVEDSGDTEAAPAAVETVSTSSRSDAASDDDDGKRDDAAKPSKAVEKERVDESKKKKKDKDEDDRNANPDKDRTPGPRRVEVLTVPPPQAVGVQVGQRDDDAEAEPQASERNRDEIIEERRRRRQERRERRARQRDVDRVRGIFEGQP